MFKKLKQTFCKHDIRETNETLTTTLGNVRCTIPVLRCSKCDAEFVKSQ